MKKKELLKGTPMKPTKKMVEMSRETMKEERWNKASITVPKFAWFYRARKIEDILEIDIFTNESIKLEAKKPVYRVFLEKSGEYATYDYRTGHWRKSTIEKLEYGESDRYYYTIRTPYMEKKEADMVAEFTGNDIAEPRSAIQKWQNAKRHRKETDEIDQEMALVPEQPKDFEDWILKEASGQYIFYDAGDKSKLGRCTHCGAIVQLKSPKYNQRIKCPNCRHEVVLKTRKKSGNIRETGKVGLLQKTKTGYAYRMFEFVIKYLNGIQKGNESGYWETGRATYDHNLRIKKEYKWGRYKQTDLVRWCYDNGHYFEPPEAERTCTALYWRNLKKTLKESPLKYSALWELAKQERDINTMRFIINYEEYLEKLIKCGFYKLALAQTGFRSVDYVRKEKQCKKILDLRGDYFKIVAGKNPTTEEYYMTHELQECGINAKWEDIKHLAAVSSCRNMAIYIRHTTLHKMRRYLKEILKDNRERTREYHDYLQMAAGLGYNLDDEWVLFPRHMEERHAQLVEEQRERDRKLQKADDAQKTEFYLESMKKHGWKNYEMETENYVIRLPKNIGEIREEGNKMHHCVATYIDRVVKGETCILFIREKERKEEPFYTMEVRNGKVIQCRAKYNGEMTEPVKKLVNIFKMKKLWRQSGIERKVG